MRQKDSMLINGVKFKCATPFDPNYRERSPVIGEVVSGNKWIREGQFAIFHHNHFYQPSPYFLKDDLFSVPFNRTVFATIDLSGELNPLCGNILCDRVFIETLLPVPEEKKKKYNDRVIVRDPGWTEFKAGQLLFTTPNAYYEIVYNFGGTEHRIHKIHSEFVIGTE